LICDEHIGSGIGEHVFKPTSEHAGRLRMAQVVEHASELLGILEPSRANGHPSRFARV